MPCSSSPPPGESNNPNDIVSVDAALLGVYARLLSIDGGGAIGDDAAAGGNLIGMGTDTTCQVLYDQSSPPPEQVDPGTELLGNTVNEVPQRKALNMNRSRR